MSKHQIFVAYDWFSTGHHPWVFLGADFQTARLDVVNSSATALVFVDSDGTKTRLLGTGLSTDSVTINWASLNSVEHLAANGTVLERINSLGAIYTSPGCDSMATICDAILSGDDSVLGSSGPDLLVGRAGNDTLQGGAGADEMFGADGNDTFVYTSAGDIPNVANAEMLVGGGGINTIQLHNAGSIDLRPAYVESVQQLQFLSGISSSSVRLDQVINGITTFIGRANADAVTITHTGFEADVLHRGYVPLPAPSGADAALAGGLCDA